MKQLVPSTKPLSAITPTAGAAGASNINGSIIDLASFEGVLFLLHFGAIVAGAVVSYKVQHGDAANGSDMADIAGTSQAVADTNSDKVFYADVRRTTKRYARLVVSRATQNATVAAVALPYGSREQPVTQTATGTKVAGVS